MSLTVRKLKAFLELVVAYHPKGHVALCGDVPMGSEWMEDMIRNCVRGGGDLGIRVMGGSRVEEAEFLASREEATSWIVARAGGWDNIICCVREYRDYFFKEWGMFCDECLHGGRGSLNVRKTARKYKVGTQKAAANFDTVLKDISIMIIARAKIL